MSPERDFPQSPRLDTANATIYENYAPPFVRVARDGRIIDSSGDLSLFMMARPGDERYVYALARDGLSDVVMPLLNDALKEKKKLALKDISVHSQFGIQ